jgi:hypothetical protein
MALVIKAVLIAIAGPKNKKLLVYLVQILLSKNNLNHRKRLKQSKGPALFGPTRLKLRAFRSAHVEYIAINIVKQKTATIMTLFL